MPVSSSLLPKAERYSFAPAGSEFMYSSNALRHAIVASAMLRLKQPDERHARPYTVAIVVAVMEIIGHFVGGFIYYVK